MAARTQTTAFKIRLCNFAHGKVEFTEPADDCAFIHGAFRYFSRTIFGSPSWKLAHHKPCAAQRGAA